MNGLIKKIVLLVGIFSLFFFFTPRWINADENIYSNLQITPVPCGCPARLNEQIYRLRGESCTNDFEEFKKDPISQHFWIRDPKTTEQGKANERARQFIYWIISHPSIDSHPIIINIWKLTKNIAYFLVIFIVALFGLGYIISQRTNFDLGIKIWPSIYKTLFLLLYITFSATIIIFLVQISDILMKFFIENLKGDQLFNIYFSGARSSEENYLTFYGCRDLNFNVQESANTEIFLLKATNITYYVMGTMLILRKVILWFMLFVSPFLALLFPFVFIRNIGWIWIGVFFQWLFYGPLFALFLGALAEIWRKGIPFPFDFSRVGTAAGHIFPTAINIFYGGPAQTLSILNNGNYIDTFAEYLITLIMLWAVIFFPWWLLRIFRDYCCDGIYAAKNILLSIYDQLRGGPTPPSPQPNISPSTISAALKIPKEVEIPVKIKLETIEEIKKAKTEEIARSVTFEAKKLTDIAHFETNRQIRETVTKNINYLKNPLQAETPTERQKFMNLKTEIYQRAVKQDTIAKNIVSAISTSSIEQQRIKEEVLKTVPQMVPVAQIITSKTALPQTKISSTLNSAINQVVNNNQIVNQISQMSQISSNQTQTILNSLNQNLTTTSPGRIIDKITKETGVEREKVVAVIKLFKETATKNDSLIKQISETEKINEEKVKELVATPMDVITAPEENIEQVIKIPASVSIDEYEQVKKMWVDHYQRGELPLSENINNRKEWVTRDIVLITNTLNKLLSDDPKLKQEGLDDISYILPIVLINNLSGEQLITYLKAKVEAAKQVKELFEKEEEVKQKLKEKTEEEKVPIETKEKAEAAKEMKMQMEMEEEKNNQSNNNQETVTNNQSSDSEDKF